MTWHSRFVASPDPEALPALRREIQAALRAAGASNGVVDRAGLLVSELAHNALEAGDGASEVRVEADLSGDGLRITVECEANLDLDGLVRAIDSSGELPSPDSERGRGLWMILALSRDLEVTRQPGGWVRLSLYVKEDGA